jgi:regulatory subunit for Cdc7p protein kinase
MASVSVAQPTHSPAHVPMSRRLPLNNVPHAVNSPLKARSAASNPLGKRQRQDATVGNDAPAMEPPTKKQAITTNAPQTPVNQKIIVREKRGGFQKKVTKQKVAVGNRDVGVVRQENAHERDNREEVLLWQRHYKKAFPTYVIFFENIPDEQGVQLYKQVKSLGSVSFLSCKRNAF